MSVAFRRESDDEHLEPKFEIPIPPGPNLVTARGLTLIQGKVDELEAGLSGLTDEEALKRHRRDLRYWRTRLATAQQMPVPCGETVEFGCTVTFLRDGKERTVTLVGDDEAEPEAGLLSFSSPIARAMMQAEVGELLPFGGKEDALVILRISASR